MKHFVVVLFAIIPGAGVLWAQSFGAVGTEWYYSEHASGGCAGNCEYVHFKSVKDTVIAGKTTHKISRTYYKQNGDTLSRTSFYVYESSDTVYQYHFQNAEFLRLYIFNAVKGDTIQLDAPYYSSGNDSTYRLVIDTVINTVIDGVPLKKYGTTALDDFQFFNGGYFMDRVGGLDWFFPRTVIIPEAGGPIRCYKDSQVDTSFQTVDCDHLVLASVPEHANRHAFGISPNPAGNHISVHAAVPVSDVKVYDLSGRLMIQTEKSKVDVSGLGAGSYVIKVGLSDGSTGKKRIIKK